MKQTSSGEKSKTLHRLSPLDVTRKGAGVYHDGGGLYLQIRAAKVDPQRVTRSWLFRYGRRWMGLGSVVDLSLAKARKKAAELREQSSDGIDPIDARRADRAAKAIEQVKAAAQATTFKQCFEDYVADKLASQTPRYVTDWKASVTRHALPVLGKLPVGTVDTHLLMKALRPIWLIKAPTARLVRSRIESILDWAKAMKLREGDNPARWRGHLEHLLAAPSAQHETIHHAALPYAEMPDFMCKLRAQTSVAAMALEFVILTCVRKEAGCGARWSEIDPRAAMWTVPAPRMKGGKEHRVPLSDAAHGVLDKAEKLRRDECVFPGGKAGRPITGMAVRKLLHGMGYGHVTIHGFRSTFRDWAAERTNFDRDTCEMVLAHEIDNKVEAAYRRGDLFAKRAKLMQEWADYCSRPSKPAGEVVEFSKRRTTAARQV
jgi:integrase